MPLLMLLAMAIEHWQGETLPPIMDFSKLIQAEIAKKKAEAEAKRAPPPEKAQEAELERKPEVDDQHHGETVPVPDGDADKDPAQTSEPGVEKDDEHELRDDSEPTPSKREAEADADVEPVKKPRVDSPKAAKPVDKATQKQQEIERNRAYEREERGADPTISPNEIRDDRDATYLHMRAYIRQTLDKWQDSLASEDETGPGYKLLIEVLTDLQPLFRQLRQQAVADKIYPTLATLLLYMQEKKFHRAHETYHTLSVGNSAWPIGVISVGMHERTSDAKLMHGSANILKDESTRRWILSVKRLLTFVENQSASHA